MQFLVDEDLATDIAVIGRRFGLDIISVHENGRERWTDEQQLAQAAIDNRCIVTGNRNDFIDLTNEFSAQGRPHAGVVIVQGALRYAEPVAVVRALVQFYRTRCSFPMEYVYFYLRPAE